MKLNSSRYSGISSSIKLLSVIMIIAIMGTLVFRFSGMASGMYEITIPSYGNQMPESYFTRDYTEKNGCIEFKDNLNIAHKFCGAYQISKY